MEEKKRIASAFRFYREWNGPTSKSTHELGFGHAKAGKSQRLITFHVMNQTSKT
jgi:hypothetical protein